MRQDDKRSRTGGIDTGGGRIIAQYVSGGDMTINQVSPETLDRLFEPLSHVVNSTPAESKPSATATVAQLKNELAKGPHAQDGVIAKSIDGLVSLVPSAVSAVVSMFASPVLSGLVGPATKYVLEHIQSMSSNV